MLVERSPAVRRAVAVAVIGFLGFSASDVAAEEPGGLVPPEPIVPAAPPPARLPPGSRGGALRVAVPEPRVTGEVPARPLAAFVQALAPEVRKLEGVSAVGFQDIRDMLGVERQRQMLGCAADEECLAEIAGALGVDEVLASELVLADRAYTATVRRIDLRRAKVLQSETRRFEERDGEELLAVIGPAVAALYPDRPLRAGKSRGVSREVLRRINPPPLPRWVFGVTAGGAVAAAGGGLVFGLLVRESERQYADLAERATTEPVPASALKALEDEARSRETTANALFITAGGLAVAAVVEAFFTDWRGERSALTAVPVAHDGGGGLVLAGRF